MKFIQLFAFHPLPRRQWLCLYVHYFISSAQQYYDT